MYLQDVEVFAYAVGHKGMFVVMKFLPGSVEAGKRFGGVSLEMRVVNEVEHAAKRANRGCITGACDGSEEDLLHLLKFMPCPLRDFGDTVLEMTKAAERGCPFEARIQFRLAHKCSAPLHEMIFEDSLVKLVENVGRDAREDVAVWEVPPKGFVNFPQPFAIETRWIEPFPM